MNVKQNLTHLLLLIAFLSVSFDAQGDAPIYGPYCTIDDDRDDPTIYGVNSVRSPDSENLFASSIFNDYIDQLKAFIRAEAPNELNAFTTYILNFEPGSVSDNRDFYMHFILLSRELFNLEQQSTDVNQFLDKFAVWIFTKPNLWEGHDRFLLAHFDAPSKKELTMKELKEFFNHVYDQTLMDESLNGRNKKLNPTHDQILHGNIPYRLFTLKNSRKTQVIRTPAPIKDISKSEVEITEEFYHYLKVMNKSGKRQLYVNLLTQKYNKGPNLDPKRREKIESLEVDSQVGDTTFVITLDKNSPFYFQKEEYQNLNDADEFIRTFSRLMFTEPSMFSWSKKLDLCVWQTYCNKLLRSIHKHYFNSKQTLTQEERQDFIDIAYLKIIKKTVNVLKIDTMNITCMHTIDRAVSILSHLYIDQQFKAKKTIGKQEAQRFVSLVLIQPVILHNQPAHDYRVERIISSSIRMYGK